MAPDTTKTFPLIHNYADFAGNLSNTGPVGWTGTLKSAVLSGSFSGDGVIAGLADAVLRVNDLEIKRWPNLYVVSHIVVDVSGIDISPYLHQGQNKLEVAFVKVSYSLNFVHIAADIDCTITSTEDVTVDSGWVNGGGTNWTTIAYIILAIVVIAIAGGLFLRFSEK
jgi:hypothetical protein